MDGSIVEQKTFKGGNVCKFQGFVAIRKVFSAKFGGVPSIGGTSRQPKVFSVKIIFSTNLQNISPSKVSCYMYLVWKCKIPMKLSKLECNKYFQMTLILYTKQPSCIPAMPKNVLNDHFMNTNDIC